MKGLIIYGMVPKHIPDDWEGDRIIEEKIAEAKSDGQHIYYLPTRWQNQLHPVIERVKDEIAIVEVPFVSGGLLADPGYSCPLQRLVVKKMCIKDKVTEVDYIEAYSHEGGIAIDGENLRDVFERGMTQSYTASAPHPSIRDSREVGIKEPELTDILSVQIPVYFIEVPIQYKDY